MRIEVLMKYQDDPKKCTAARLLKAGIARRVESIREGSRRIVLNPYSDTTLVPSDRRAAGAVVGIDCSWRLADREFAAGAAAGRGHGPDCGIDVDDGYLRRPRRHRSGTGNDNHLLRRRPSQHRPRGSIRAGQARHHTASRRLPPLLAGNPVNYARVGMLTTAEAIAASLFIMGYAEQGHGILARFKWGHTFYDLNCRLLAEYARMTEQGDAVRIAADYGLPAVQRDRYCPADEPVADAPPSAGA